MGQLLSKYRDLYFQIYNGMSAEKQKEWTFEFIFNSLNQVEAFFVREEMTYEAEAALKEKIHRLKHIKYILENFYQGTYSNLDRAEFIRLTKYAIECNNLIIEQIIDLTFNKGMNSEQRRVQLSSVLPNYFFVQFELNKINKYKSTSKLKTMKLDFIFKSSNHLRYENGKHVSGPHGKAGRAVKVEPNISGGEGYTVTLFNLDGNHPVWQNNVQMAPKQMKVIQQTVDKIVLRGYGHDAMGASFADYGLTIKLKNGELENCILHMHDRGVDIEYLL